MWMYDHTVLRTLREQQGRSRREVCAADKLDITQHTLMGWEMGKKAPRADYLALLATVYEVTVESFFKQK